MTQLQFSKMHALGNDFILVDGVRAPVQLSPEQIRLLGDRNRGVGFDQALIVLPPQSADNDFACAIYNSDGSTAGHCGNGMRCFMKFVLQSGLSHRSELKVELANRLTTLHLLDDDHYQVDMGFADFAYANIPFQPPTAQQQSNSLSPAAIDDIAPPHTTNTLYPLSLGNPHAVLFVDDVASCDVAQLGAAISHHRYFPDQANVGFAQKLDAHHLRLRVYERGVGETSACGSGACAAVVAGQEFLSLGAEVKVQLPGGELTVARALDSHNARVYLRGAAVHVFTGSIDL